MPKGRQITKEELIFWYVQKDKTILEVARILGVSSSRVQRNLKKHDISRRAVGGSIKRSRHVPVKPKNIWDVFDEENKASRLIDKKISEATRRSA